MSSFERPITPAMLAGLVQLGPAAIERHDAFGRADRREAVIALALAGGAPLAGLVVLGWEPAVVIVSLLLNLLLRVGDDIARVMRSHGRLQEFERLQVEDEFVWPVAGALARGRRSVPAKGVPELADVAARRSPMPLGGAAFLAFLMCAFALPFLLGPGAVIGSGTLVALGSAPSVALSVAFAFLHRTAEHRDWRRAASVRLQTGAVTAWFTHLLGMLVFFIVTLGEKAPLDDRQLALTATLATLGYAGYRAWELREREFTRRVLAQRLADHRAFGAAL